MVCPPFQGLVSPCRLPLSPISLLVSLSWIACPPSRGLVSLGLPLAPIVLHSLPLSPHTCACVGRCVCLPEVSPIVSHCLQLSPHLCARVGWSTFPKSSRKSWNVNGRTWSQRRIMSFPTSSPVAPQVRKAKRGHRNTRPLILFLEWRYYGIVSRYLWMFMEECELELSENRCKCPIVFFFLQCRRNFGCILIDGSNDLQ